jgi:hypothetical protein
MGYIGLLLNAPYKIDSMVWMSLWISTALQLVSVYLCFWLAKLTKGKMGCRAF